MDLTVEYDYIICGGGCAGLSLAMKFTDKEWAEKKILIIDSDLKNINDRTWCSWITREDFFTDIQRTFWNHIYFYGPGISKKLDTAPYQYRMVRGIDFYKKADILLSNSGNIKRVVDRITAINEFKNHVEIITTKGKYKAKMIFKSYFDGKIDKKKNLYVDQHFKGFFIRTEKPVFDSKSATFMDFRIPQCNEVRFMYVLPEDEYSALVELAIFSNEILSQEDYDNVLKAYIKEKLQIEEYIIEETEFGIIPMTNYPFYKHDTKNIVHIGTAAGTVKPSSGFAFIRIQEHTDAIMDCLKKGIHPSKAQQVFKPIFKLMDSTLLDVFLIQKKSGAEIFAQLFRGNTPAKVFKFLDEKTGPWETLTIITKVKWPPFIKGAFRQLFLRNY